MAIVQAQGANGSTIWVDTKTNKQVDPATGQPIPSSTLGKPAPKQTLSNPSPAPTAAPPYNPVIEAGRNAQTSGNSIIPRFNDTVIPSSVAAREAIDQGTAWDRLALDTQGRNTQTFNSNLNDIISGQRSNTAGTNATGSGILAGNRAAANGLIGGLGSSYQGFQQGMDPLRGSLAAPGGYTDYVSNAQDVANQQRGLSNFSDIYGGGLDYQAAQWASDPADVQRQLDSYNTLNGIGGGSLDYTAAQAAYREAQYREAQYQTAATERAQAHQAQLRQWASDPSDVERQRKAVDELGSLVNGGEWADSQREVREKYKGLTNPEITDQERFINEQFRQQSEGMMRANREATMADLGQRGIRSGAAELVGMGQYNQQVGNERVLSELGASANAVDRSMRAMEGWNNASNAGRGAQLQASGMYTDASGQMRQQSDNVGMFNTAEGNSMNKFNADVLNQNSMFNADQQNTNNRFNADAFNQNSMFNANAYNNNQEFNANAYNTNQMFNTQQTNNAQSDNQRTRLSGYQSAADQSNAIRTSNDYVGTFNTGERNTASANNQRTRMEGATGYANQANAIRTSNDMIGTFNKEQGMIQSRHQDDFRMADAERKQGVERDLLNGANTTAGTMWGIQSNADQNALTENQNTWARGASDAGMAMNGEGQKLDANNSWTNQMSQFGDNIASGGMAKHGMTMSEQGLFQGGVTAGANTTLAGAGAEQGEYDKLKAIEMAEAERKRAEKESKEFGFLDYANPTKWPEILGSL